MIRVRSWEMILIKLIGIPILKKIMVKLEAKAEITTVPAMPQWMQRRMN